MPDISSFTGVIVLDNEKASNDLLRVNSQVKWVKLFSGTPSHLYALAPSSGLAALPIALLASGVKDPPDSSASSTDTGSLYAISGSGIKDLTISLPPGANDGIKTDTLRTFWLPDSVAKNFKSIVVQPVSGAPLVLALPSAPSAGAPAAAPKVSINPQKTGIAATTKTLNLTGTRMSQVVAVVSGLTPLTFTSSDDKSLTLALPTLSPPGLTLVFIYSDKSPQPYFIPVANTAAP
jgi:hypothetical protein